jgi:mannose-6-phosphate isomerase-like protein (cupin superfamily)
MLTLSNINIFKRGWIIGNFEPSIYKADYEVGIHRYKSGEKCQAHYHAETQEINVVVKGKCLFRRKCGDNWQECHLKAGDILIADPMEILEFHAIKDCTLVVLKPKSIPNDKYLV